MRIVNIIITYSHSVTPKPWVWFKIQNLNCVELNPVDRMIHFLPFERVWVYMMFLNLVNQENVSIVEQNVQLCQFECGNVIRGSFEHLFIFEMWFASDLHEWVKLLSFGNLITERGRDSLNLPISLAASLPISKNTCNHSRNKLIAVDVSVYSPRSYALKSNDFGQLLLWWSLSWDLKIYKHFTLQAMCYTKLCRHYRGIFKGCQEVYHTPL